MKTIITGLFENPAQAANAVHRLEARGFRHSDISVIAGEGFNKEAFAVDTHSKLAEGAAVGAGTLGAVGAIVAGFTAVGAVAATGGVGLIAAGPLVASLAGAGAGAATGGVLGGLVGLAIPEHEVKHYEDAIKEGSVLVGVECKDGDAKKLAKEVFDNCDATKVSHA